MAKDSKVTLYNWDAMPKERVSATLERRLITGERAMLAQIFLAKGCIVPHHSHDNEQFSYVIEGRIRFWIGEDGKDEIDVGPGEVLHLPSNVPHSAEALVDFIGIDVFSPPRQDWLDKTDDYLRR